MHHLFYSSYVFSNAASIFVISISEGDHASQLFLLLSTFICSNRFHFRVIVSKL